MEFLANIFTTEVIQYFLELVYLALATGMGLLLKAAIAYLKQKIGIDKLEAFKAQVEVTVAFLEQFGVNIGLDNGLLKKEYAVNFLYNKAEEMGLKLSYDEVSALVEAFVFATTG